MVTEDRWGVAGVRSRSLGGVPWETVCPWPLVHALSASQLPSAKQFSSTYLYHEVLLLLEPRAMELADLGMNLQNCEPKIIFSSFKLFLSGILVIVTRAD